MRRFVQPWDVSLTPSVFLCFQWEAQHQDLSCEQFQQWKRENDPEYQRQGLAGYLRDNGISEAADFNHTWLSFHFFISRTSLCVNYYLLSGRLTNHRVYLCNFVATAAKKFNLLNAFSVMCWSLEQKPHLHDSFSVNVFFPVVLPACVSSSRSLSSLQVPVRSH